MFRILLILFIALTGCAGPGTPPPSSLSEVNQKLQAICDGDLKLSCRLFPAGDTLWVYVPVEFRFIELTAVGGRRPKSPAAQKTLSLEYLDGYFKDGEFVIFYDAREKVSYPENPGYQNKYTDEFTVTRQTLMSALYRAYGGYQQTPGTEKAPLFVVVVLADIGRGLETRMMMTLTDLIRGMTDSGFYEEFARRVVNKPLAGNPEMIGDKTGRSLRPVNLSWPEFLTEQILYRVNVKYQKSEAAPENAENAVLEAATEVLRTYRFRDFETVRVKDLKSGKTAVISRELLLSSP